MINDGINDIALMLFSSETINIPKAIMLSNLNIETNVESIQDYLKLKNTDRILLIKNINHASSIVGDYLLEYIWDAQYI